MNENEKYWMMKAMRVYGGSFVKALAMAWMYADVFNWSRLEKAFPDYIKKYQEMGRRLEEKSKEKGGK